MYKCKNIEPKAKKQIPKQSQEEGEKKSHHETQP
jgi:hypothetical protein